MDEEESGDTFDMNIKISDPVKVGKPNIYFQLQSFFRCCNKIKFLIVIFYSRMEAISDLAKKKKLGA